MVGSSWEKRNPLSDWLAIAISTRPFSAMEMEMLTAGQLVRRKSLFVNNIHFVINSALSPLDAKRNVVVSQI
jgi:hypothetical protein